MVRRWTVAVRRWIVAVRLRIVAVRLRIVAVRLRIVAVRRWIVTIRLRIVAIRRWIVTILSRTVTIRGGAGASKGDTLPIMETHPSPAVQLAEEESARLVGLLSRLVRLSKKSMRSLEAELGLGSSVVSKILAGAIRPQLSYVLMIASAVGVAPEEFFSLAYRLKKRVTNPLLKELMEVEGTAEVEDRDIRVSPEQLDQLVDAAVRRALQRLGTEPGASKRQTD